MIVSQHNIQCKFNVWITRCASTVCFFDIKPYNFNPTFVEYFIWKMYCNGNGDVQYVLWLSNLRIIVSAKLFLVAGWPLFTGILSRAALRWHSQQQRRAARFRRFTFPTGLDINVETMWKKGGKSVKIWMNYGCPRWSEKKRKEETKKSVKW